MTGIAKNLFTLIKPQILANNKRYEDGKKGGRPKKKTSGFFKSETSGFEKQKPVGCKNKKTNVNDNVNENVNVNVNLSLLKEGEREILESFARRRKVDSVSAYVDTLITNGDYLIILEEEKKRIEREKEYEENRFYKPEEYRQQTPEEIAECDTIIKRGKQLLAQKIATKSLGDV